MSRNQLVAVDQKILDHGIRSSGQGTLQLLARAIDDEGAWREDELELRNFSRDMCEERGYDAAFFWSIGIDFAGNVGVAG